MTRTAVAIYFGAALMAAWAILRAWDHLTRRVPPPDPLDAIQPWDCRSVTLADGRGVFSRN
jgi:hypothetical protein